MLIMSINILIFTFTPFLISPRGEMIVLLLPPWGKVGKGVLN
jgi:hypothetical protein